MIKLTFGVTGSVGMAALVTSCALFGLELEDGWTSYRQGDATISVADGPSVVISQEEWPLVVGAAESHFTEHSSRATFRSSAGWQLTLSIGTFDEPGQTSGIWAVLLTDPEGAQASGTTSVGCESTLPVKDFTEIDGTIARPVVGSYQRLTIQTRPTSGVAVEVRSLHLHSETHLRGDPLIRDQRGPDAAALLWADGGETLYCLVSRAPGGGVAVHLVGGSTADPATRGRLMAADTVCEDPTLVTGFVPAGAGALAIGTEAGLEVTASTADGRFLAWWPGRDDPVTLRAGTSTADHGGRC